MFLNSCSYLMKVSPSMVECSQTVGKVTNVVGALILAMAVNKQCILQVKSASHNMDLQRGVYCRAVNFQQCQCL